ncbi:23S rRNA (guanosine(2251)-2'-O)-methyltransferase RlmB [Microlunatus speluncae]|uniref:23S rRNA (guanosine(2251)-2'-O)-methyltransferase RlmB n=1 Tax=Microlunatus speluncae TaxID=2594267 RepID=UPI00126628D6|nr:23S rRNA (guanosine(2251)-2'-O)-methyltransferase RlmB [Microlunatus speluncae]
MPGNSQRKGAIRRKGKGNTAGSGGRVRRGLEGKGPTPKAEDRPYHPAHKAKKAQGARQGTNRPSASGSDRGRGPGTRPDRAGGPRRSGAAGAEWVVGRNPVLEAMLAEIPVKSGFVAEGADRDDRLSDIFKIAAERHMPLLQVTRNELERLVGDAVHQGVALQLPEFVYAHPDDLLADAVAAGDQGLVVALDGISDPRNLGAIVRSAAAFGAQGVLIPERRAAGMTAAAWKSSAGAAARLQIARATNLNRALRSYADAGLTLVGLDGTADTTLAKVAETRGPTVLVVGAEGSGLSRLVREACDVMASIPMAAEVESLNAGVATGIALYELSR